MDSPRPSVLLLLGAVWVATGALGIAFLLQAASPDGVAWSGRGMWRRPMDWQTARILFGSVGGLIVVIAATGLFRAARQLATYRTFPGETLALGEPIRWRGRPGWASFDRQRAIVAALVLPTPLPLIASLWLLWTSRMIHSGEPAMFAGAIAMSAAILTALGPIAFGPALLLLSRENRWLCELVGDVCVTDRRIVWRLPGGRIAHSLERGELLDAHMIEAHMNAGWIELKESRGGREKLYDLRGVRDPAKALTAMRWLLA